MNLRQTGVWEGWGNGGRRIYCVFKWLGLPPARAMTPGRADSADIPVLCEPRGTTYIAGLFGS